MSDDPFALVTKRADPALVVVTAASDGRRAGCLVGFHSQCSIKPRRYAVWLSTLNFTYRVALHSTHLGVHFLSEDDRALAELFGGTSGDAVDKLAQCDHVVDGPAGVPILTDVADRFVVNRLAVLDTGGDHVCFVGGVLEATAGADRAPMRYGDAEDIEAGHPMSEEDG